MSAKLFQCPDGSLVVSAETARKFELGEEVTIRFPVPGDGGKVATFTLKRES